MMEIVPDQVYERQKRRLVETALIPESDAGRTALNVLTHWRESL